MKRSFGILVVVAGLSAWNCGSARADEKDATPVIDAAIKALGGEENLAKATSYSTKSKGTITINNDEMAISMTMTVQGIDHQHGEFEIDFNGQPFQGLAIYNGVKGWRKFGDNLIDLDEEGTAAARQGTYLMVVATTILPMKGKGFKAELAPEGTVDGKPADVVKATGPDGKPFTLYFSKETHLPLRMVAKLKGMQGEEYEQEMNYSDYKDVNGIKRAMKTVTKRDGNPFSKSEISEFKVIDKPDPTLFDEPK